MSLNKYEGGYDLEFLDQNWRKYECPICLLCLRDPHQTSCGHRFCRSCILRWLDEGRRCPKDNASLGEGDIFEDHIARREIGELRVKCPREKCDHTSILARLEQHLINAHNENNDNLDSKKKSNNKLSSLSNASKTESTRVACVFASLGCGVRVLRGELQSHMEQELQSHMALICDKLNKLAQTNSMLDSSEELENAVPFERHLSERLATQTLSRDDDRRVSSSNIRTTQRLLNELYQRLITLEQRACRLEIVNEQLQRKIEQVDEEELSLRFCQGNFVWYINDFLNQISTLTNEKVYSKGFFTNAFGYKMCLRCHISKDSKLNLYIHMMRGPFDNSLSWPWSGVAMLSVINVDDHERNVCEMLDARHSRLAAFERPSNERSVFAFGVQNIIEIQHLIQYGFLDSNGALLIRAQISTDNMLCSGNNFGC